MNTVLIVDDSKIIRDLLEKIFSNLFFKTYVASDGEEALEVFAKNNTDVIILDYNLPIVEGIDVLYKIRTMKNVKQPKVIFCSSINSLFTIKEAIKAGCDDYIIKPFDEELIALKLKILGVI